VCLFWVSAASALSVWDGGGVDDLWTTANNWNPNSVPTSSDNAQINNGSVLIDDTVHATVLNTDLLRVPTGGVDTPVLTMTGGSLINLGLTENRYPMMIGSKGNADAGRESLTQRSGGNPNAGQAFLGGGMALQTAVEFAECL
jgi:hypothetical protein